MKKRKWAIWRGAERDRCVADWGVGGVRREDRERKREREREGGRRGQVPH